MSFVGIILLFAICFDFTKQNEISNTIRTGIFFKERVSENVDLFYFEFDALSDTINLVAFPWKSTDYKEIFPTYHENLLLYYNWESDSINLLNMSNTPMTDQLLISHIKCELIPLYCSTFNRFKLTADPITKLVYLDYLIRIGSDTSQFNRISLNDVLLLKNINNRYYYFYK